VRFFSSLSFVDFFSFSFRSGLRHQRARVFIPLIFLSPEWHLVAFHPGSLFRQTESWTAPRYPLRQGFFPRLASPVLYFLLTFDPLYLPFAPFNFGWIPSSFRRIQPGSRSCRPRSSFSPPWIHGFSGTFPLLDFHSLHALLLSSSNVSSWKGRFPGFVTFFLRFPSDSSLLSTSQIKRVFIAPLFYLLFSSVVLNDWSCVKLTAHVLFRCENRLSLLGLMLTFVPHL